MSYSETAHAQTTVFVLVSLLLNKILRQNPRKGERVQLITVGKSRQQEHEAADHMMLTLRKQGAQHHFPVHAGPSPGTLLPTFGRSFHLSIVRKMPPQVHPETSLPGGSVKLTLKTGTNTGLWLGRGSNDRAKRLWTEAIINLFLFKLIVSGILVQYQKANTGKVDVIPFLLISQGRNPKEGLFVAEGRRHGVS